MCRKTTNKSLLHESRDIDLAICSSMLSCFLTTSHIEKMRFLHYLCCIDEYIDIRQCLLEHTDEIQSITHCSASTAKKWGEINPFTWCCSKRNHFQLCYCFDVKVNTNLNFWLLYILQDFSTDPAFVSWPPFHHTSIFSSAVSIIWKYLDYIPRCISCWI